MRLVVQGRESQKGSSGALALMLSHILNIPFMQSEQLEYMIGTDVKVTVVHDVDSIPPGDMDQLLEFFDEVGLKYKLV